MPGETAKWDSGVWDIALWDQTFGTFAQVGEDGYTAFLRRFHSQHEVALSGLAELLQLHHEKRKV